MKMKVKHPDIIGNMMLMRFAKIAQPSGSDQPAALWHCTRREWTRKSP